MTTPAFTNTMSAADALMWTIERDPLLRSTITAVALLDRRPDWRAVQQRMAEAAAAIPRLRQRVVVPAFRLGPPQWVDDPGFDLDFHLRRLTLPRPAGVGDVLDFACRSAMAGFDRARPLWEFTIIEGLDGGQAALIQKVHHSATDGVGGVRLLVEMLDATRKPKGRRPTQADPAATTGASGLAARAAELPRAFTQFAGRFATPPLSLPGAFVGQVRSAAKLLAPSSEPLSPIMRGRGLLWNFGTLDADLAGMRAAAATVGGSVNDAFLAGVAGGLHRYHEKHGATVERLRMTLPVSIRSDADPLGGNRFVPVRFPMPVAELDPAARMLEAGRLVASWRAEPALKITDALAGILDRLPAEVVTRIFGGMLKNVDFVATNVAGLPVPMYLGGAELVRQYAFAPLSGAAANIALLSHVGTCCIGINSDRAAIPDPDVFTACLRAGLDEVLDLADAEGTAIQAS
jgi:WS/DGAT/MGAT family acyltransferase